MVNARAAELCARNAELALKNDAARQQAMTNAIGESVRMFGNAVQQLSSKDAVQKTKAALALLREMKEGGDIDGGEYKARRGRLLDKLEG